MTDDTGFRASRRAVLWTGVVAVTATLIPARAGAQAKIAQKLVQYQDDVAIEWKKDMNAADIAYVLYQAPVLVAVHGAEMLKPGGA